MHPMCCVSSDVEKEVAYKTGESYTKNVKALTFYNGCTLCVRVFSTASQTMFLHCL